VVAFDDNLPIGTARLDLALLRVEDADDMAAVLADEQLHEFIGGQPATLAELRTRYARLAAGSGDPDEVWLNWIARRRADTQAIGTLQTTLIAHDGSWTAYVAWVIGVDWQNQGFASEAAQALVAWLQRNGIHDIVAHIHPEHQASALVATRAGLRPTDEFVDGEQVWRAPAW
jgi:RimJ/RimL family protein N-acetyltransferase